MYPYIRWWQRSWWWRGSIDVVHEAIVSLHTRSVFLPMLTREIALQQDHEDLFLSGDPINYDVDRQHWSNAQGRNRVSNSLDTLCSNSSHRFTCFLFNIALYNVSDECDYFGHACWWLSSYPKHETEFMAVPRVSSKHYDHRTMGLGARGQTSNHSWAKLLHRSNLWDRTDSVDDTGQFLHQLYESNQISLERFLSSNT